MSYSWQLRPVQAGSSSILDGPLGLIELERLLNILTALSLTDCDKRTLAIVATSTGLAEFWCEPVEIQAEQKFITDNSD